MPKVLNILLIVIMLAFIAYFFVFKTSKSSGDMAPEITATLTNGQAFSLSELKGKYVLLDFWASWCGPCIREAPKLVQLQNQFNGQQFVDADGFEIVSIATEKNDKTWKMASERLGFNWKYQILDIARFVRMSKIASDYGVTEIPSKFLISPKGEILRVNPDFEELTHILNSNKG